MVKLYSRLLEETIVCVEDSHRSDEDGGVQYTRSEVLALQGLGNEEIRAVHDLKKYFGGKYIGPAPNMS